MSGGVYCPLSPDEPQARLDVCIEECQPRCILVHSQTANRFDNELNSAQIIIKAFDPAQENVFHFFPALSMDSLAIVVFTSGSTGRPKGVCLSQRNFVNYLAASKHEQILLSSDIVLQRAPVTVSMHLQDIVSSLCVGASIVAVRPGNHRDITYLLNLIKRHQITFVFLVPSLLAAIFEDTVDVENKCGYLRLVLTGGKIFLIFLIIILYFSQISIRKKINKQILIEGGKYYERKNAYLKKLSQKKSTF